MHWMIIKFGEVVSFIQNKHLIIMSYGRGFRDRQERAFSQRLYLIGLGEQTEDELIWQVMGSRGISYQVRVNDEVGVICECPDYKRREEICKHGIFVISRVCQCPELAHRSSFNKSIRDQLWEYYRDNRRIVSNIVIDLTNEEEPDGKSDLKVERKEWKPEDDCPICFESFGEEDLTWCQKQCGASFHQTCMDMVAKYKGSSWKMSSRSVINCPLCRAPWTKT